MSNEEIIENNRLIFDFMGCVHSKDSVIDLWEMSDLKYRYSYDALIPVVEKIESLGYKVQICRRNVEIKSDENNENVITPFVSKEETKIISCLYACIQFIKWYNTTIITNE